MSPEFLTASPACPTIGLSSLPVGETWCSSCWPWGSCAPSPSATIAWSLWVLDFSLDCWMDCIFSAETGSFQWPLYPCPPGPDSDVWRQVSEWTDFSGTTVRSSVSTAEHAPLISALPKLSPTFLQHWDSFIWNYERSSPLRLGSIMG